MAAALPAPRTNPDSAAYWEAAAGERLVVRRCADCAALHFPPRHLCPSCWSDRLEWVDASGLGRVYTFTVMRRAPMPEFAAAVPYVVALIDLDEGPRLMANIVGDDAFEVAIGDRVEVCFEVRGEARVPQFRRRAA